MRSTLFPLGLALLSACSSSSSSPAAPSSSSGGSDDAGAPEASTVDPTAAYEQAVLAASWQKLPSGPTVSGGAKQDDVFFTSPAVGYVADGPGFAIHKTTDGGATWTKAFEHKGTFFRALLFLDDSHGFAGNLGAGLDPSIDDTNVLYETKDAGGTWTPVTTISGDKPSGICNLTGLDDKQHLFAVGRANGPSHFMTSSDGGATWASKDVTTILSMVIDAHFSSPTEGILAGMGADTSTCTIVRTTDGGTSWKQVFSSKTKNSLCWKLSFPTSDVGYSTVQDTTGGPGTFAKTTDGGATWTEMPLPVTKTYPAIGIGFVTPNVGWVAPEDPTQSVYRTNDGGNTWTEEKSLAAPINRFRFVDKKTAYAVGGAVYKLAVDWSGN